MSFINSQVILPHMGRNIGVCGINCDEYEAYLLTRNADMDGLEALAKKWSEGRRILMGRDVLCCGCTSPGGPLFEFSEECEVRTCAYERGYARCSECDDFPCLKLATIYEKYPGAKENLERLRE